MRVTQYRKILEDMIEVDEKNATEVESRMDELQVSLTSFESRILVSRELLLKLGQRKKGRKDGVPAILDLGKKKGVT